MQLSSPLSSPLVATEEDSCPNSGLNSYLQSVAWQQKQKAAKERRMKRMAILKMKRMSGQISFDSSLRYENKRRR